MATALILESPGANNSTLDLLLQEEGWDIERESDPAQALRRLEHGKFTLLLADSSALTGEEALIAEVRNTAPDLPVILVSSNGADAATVHALHIGAATYVPKSAIARDLVGTIKRIMALCGRPGSGRLEECLAEAMHRYSLPNDRSILPLVICHVQTQLERFQICEKADCLRIAVALEEALTNAIVHGNLEVPSSLREGKGDAFERLIAENLKKPPYATRRTAFTASFRSAEAVFVITDEGPGFDPADVPDPLDPENLVKPHGRGLLLMRTFMDEVIHNDRGNSVTLVKRSNAQKSN